MTLTILRTAVGCLLCISLQPTAALGATEKDAALRAFAATEFASVGRLADLPIEVRSALDLDARPMAETGAAWNPGCVGDARPSRRFLFAGKSPRRWFVFSESGGRAHFYELLTLRRDEAGGLVREGAWWLPRSAKNLQELKSMLEAKSNR